MFGAEEPAYLYDSSRQKTPQRSFRLLSLEKRLLIGVAAEQFFFDLVGLPSDGSNYFRHG